MTITPDTLPTATYYGPTSEPLPRFPGPTGPCGTIHPCDPAAVARLHALLRTAERRAAKAQLSGLAARDRGDLLANIRVSGAEANARRLKTLTEAQLLDAVARHARGENWAAIASDHGISHSTLMSKIRAAGYPTGRAK